MLCLVLNGSELPHCSQFVNRITEQFPELASIMLNINRERTNVILGLVWTDKAKKEGYTGDKRTIAFVLSLVGLIGGLVVLIVTVILINVLAVPGITALRDMLGMISEMANDI